MKKNLQKLKKQIGFFAILFFFGSIINAQCVQSFYDDFETGAFGPPWLPGTGHTMVVNTVAPAQGTFALNLSGTSSHYQGPNVTFTAAQPTYISWRIKSTSNTIANGYVVVGDASTTSNNGIVFSYITNNSLRFYNTTSYDYAITTNTWYHVELKNINWTAKTFDIWINNVVFQTGFAFRSLSSVDASRLFIYNFSAGATSSYDRIVIGMPPPSVTASPTIANVCPGSSVTLNGGGALTYTWTGGVIDGSPFSPTVSATYTVTGSDANGCQNTATTSVNIYTSSLTAMSSSSAICNGSSAALTANGATTYTWNTSANTASISVSPSSSSVYTVTGTDLNSCVYSTTIGLTVNPSPTLSIVSSSSILCVGQTASLSVSGASTYTWNTSSNNTVIAVSPTITTSYSVTGTDAIGCTNISTISQSVSACTGLVSTNEIEKSIISVYPNPNNGEFVLSANVEIELIIINTLGQIVKTITLNETNNHHVSVSNIANGIYFVVGQHDKKTISKKIIINK
ncbi:MAG: T9SS type A sorting domain-containing protein [Bacteroidota bacterium]|nr:T9SS type A sorting domain-containing protein [Bacteroidota bacterium]